MSNDCDGTSAVVNSDAIKSFVVPIIKDLQFLLKAYPDIIYARYIGNVEGIIFKKKLKTIKDVTNGLYDGFGFIHNIQMSQMYTIQQHLTVLLRIYRMSTVSDSITLSSEDNMKLHSIWNHWNSKKMEDNFNSY